MADETGICAAAFFRTVGKDVVTADEFVMSASLELKWMPPSKAKALLKLLEAEGAVACGNGYVRLDESLAGMDLPMAYRPSAELMARLERPAPEPKKKEEPLDPFHALMAVAERSGMKKVDFIQSCNRIQKKLDIDIGAAALIVLRDAGTDIAPYVDMVRDNIRTS